MYTTNEMDADGDAVIRRKTVTGRKPNRCEVCREIQPAGTCWRITTYKASTDGKIGTQRACADQAACMGRLSFVSAMYEPRCEWPQCEKHACFTLVDIRVPFKPAKSCLEHLSAFGQAAKHT